MAGINKVILVGRVGKDPKVNALKTGDMVANFSIATSETWKDKASGERKEKTEWHNVVVFNDNIAKIVQSYVKKGSLVGIEGQLQTRKYTDQAGVEKYVTEVVVSKFRGELSLLGSKDDGAEGGGSKPASISKAKSPDDDFPNDDIPF